MDNDRTFWILIAADIIAAVLPLSAFIAVLAIADLILRGL